MTIEYLSVTDVSKRLGISTAAVSAQTPAPTSVGSSAPTTVHLALRVSRAMVRSVVEHGQ